MKAGIFFKMKLEFCLSIIFDGKESSSFFLFYQVREQGFGNNTFVIFRKW
jgi:hypothetical protein